MAVPEMLKGATKALDDWVLAVELYANSAAPQHAKWLCRNGCSHDTPGQYEYGAVELTMQRLLTEVPAVCLWAVLPR